jgi:hypothetical protein
MDVAVSTLAAIPTMVINVIYYQELLPFPGIIYRSEISRF